MSAELPDLGIIGTIVFGVLAINAIVGSIAAFTHFTPLGRWVTKKKPLFQL